MLAPLAGRATRGPRVSQANAVRRVAVWSGVRLTQQTPVSGGCLSQIRPKVHAVRYGYLPSPPSSRL